MVTYRFKRKTGPIVLTPFSKGIGQAAEARFLAGGRRIRGGWWLEPAGALVRQAGVVASSAWRRAFNRVEASGDATAARWAGKLTAVVAADGIGAAAGQFLWTARAIAMFNGEPLGEPLSIDVVGIAIVQQMA